MLRLLREWSAKLSRQRIARNPLMLQPPCQLHIYLRQLSNICFNNFSLFQTTVAFRYIIVFIDSELS